MAMARRSAANAKALLGPLEYEVLQALWAGSPANVATVLELVNSARTTEQQVAYTTVMTVLARLHDKGILERNRQGRGYSYQPRFTEQELVEYLSQQEVERIMDRFGPVALAQFASALADADPDLLRQLREEAADDA